jgi:putative nucleotidyltransferase with HDIG domain
MSIIPTRIEAYNLLLEYNQSRSLIQHALSVEAVMRHMAVFNNEDVELWGAVGLLHDLDYEKYPNEHCTKTKEILESRNYSNDFIRAIVSHGWGVCSDIEPQTIMEKTLFAMDELAGFVQACIYVRPSKSAMDLETKSVMKKWKVKGFAAGANRETIEKGAEMLGATLESLIEHTIASYRELEKSSV